MKKILFLLFFVSVTSIAYCQNEAKNYEQIVSQIDTLIKKYDVRDIQVSSTHEVSIGPTKDFSFDKGFLIVDKLNYYNLEKLVSFSVYKIPYQHTYRILLSFN